MFELSPHVECSCALKPEARRMCTVAPEGRAERSFVRENASGGLEHFDWFFQRGHCKAGPSTTCRISNEIVVRVGDVEGGGRHVRRQCQIGGFIIPRQALAPPLVIIGSVRWVDVRAQRMNVRTQIVSEGVVFLNAVFNEEAMASDVVSNVSRHFNTMSAV